MIKKKTIHEIAQEAGVSIATVSRVLNESGNVKEATKQRVLAACHSSEYPLSAPVPSSSHSMTIGVLINHTAKYFFLNETYTNALLGASVTAKEFGYRLLLDITEDGNDIENLFHEHRVDGFLLMGIQKNSKILPRLQKEQMPFVLVGSYHQDNSVCQVDINDEKAICDAVSYLIGLGHREIGIITGSLEYTSCQDRIAGYRRAFQLAGLPVCENHIQTCEALSEVKAEQLAKHLLFQNPRVTAIVAFNDTVAMAIYKAAKDCGLKIPEQLSVIGFDDTTVASYMSPSLTSIWQPSYEKGEKAMRQLISALEQDQLPSGRKELNCIIMYRDSCAPCCLSASAD